MTERALIKEEAKKQIRALLLSSPVGLTLGELKRDYEAFIGNPLPYRELGYNTAEDFIKDIPDTVNSSWQKGIMVLKSPSDSRTEHIERMVSRQKIPNPKKWAVLRRTPGSLGSRQSHRSGTTVWNSSQSRPRFSASVPAYVRNQVKQLFRSYPDGLPITHFETAFSRRFGCRLDCHRLGFNSLGELLQSIPDVVNLKDFRTGETRVTPAFQVPGYHEGWAPSHGYGCRQSQDHEITPCWPDAQSSSKIQIPPALKTDEKHRELSGGSSKSLSDTRPRSSNSFGSVSADIDEDVGISLTLQDELRQVLASRPKGIWASRLTFEYKVLTAKELSFKDHGYLSVIEFVSALPHIVRIERPNPKGDWLLYDARLKKEEKEPVLVKEVQTNVRHDIPAKDRHLSDAFKESIRQVLQTHHDGILMTDFPRIYQEMTGNCFEGETTGFKSLEQVLLSLTDNVLQVVYKGEGRLVLYAIGSEEPRKFDQLLEKYQPHAAPEPDIFVSGIPPDSVGPGTYFTPVELPSQLTYIEVFVSNIVSPGLFWIQLIGGKTTKALEVLMDRLESYHRAEGDEYKMPESLIAVGQVCAVLFPEDNNWHRGIITGIRTIDFVDVYYVDYGSTCSVHKKTLRLLRTKYLRLPAQAIQARLSNVQPVGEKWSMNARDRMLQICLNKPLVAFLTGFKDRVLSVCLADTTSDVDIHINDLLVHEVYAQFVPDTVQTSLAGPEKSLEVPDDSLLYGADVAPCNQTLEGVPMTTNSQQETFTSGQEIGFSKPLSTGQRFVRQFELMPDVTINVVNMESEPYLLSAEVSALFWEADIIRSMLQQKKLELRKIVVNKSEYPSLFQELIMLGVKSVDERKELLTLYALSGLPTILNVFKHPSVELRSKVEELLYTFDASNPFWKGEDSDDSSDNLGADELKLILQTLQFKRKRILQSMLSETVSQVEAVNELNEIELKILKTKEMIEEVEALESETSESQKSSPRKPEVHSLKLLEQVAQPAGTQGQSQSLQTLRTNRVAPMIVNPVSQTNKNLQSSSSGTGQSDSSPDSVITNTEFASFMQQQQLLQSMLLSQAGMAGWDFSKMPGMAFPNMFNPYMANHMLSVPQMPSLGRGQSLQDVNSVLGVPNFSSSSGIRNMVNMPAGQNAPGVQNMPTLQNMLPMQNVASGQASASANMGLLPGLLPLLQNLSVGRGGGGGPNSGKNNQ